MKIEAGKRYMMRYGGITAPLMSHPNGCWTDGPLSWFQSGSYGSVGQSSRDLISEYNPHAAPCELREGGKYTTQLASGEAGPVVELRKSFWNQQPLIRNFLPFTCALHCACYVTPTGEIHSVFSQLVGRITGEFIEPKPPTPIERLERWHAGYMKNNGYAETLESIIADLKAEAAK